MTTTNSTAKGVALLHLAMSVLIWGPIAFDPMKMYETVDLDSSISPQQSAIVVEPMLVHMSFLACYLLILKAAIVLCLVFTLDSPRLGMLVIIISWLLNAACQIFFPWPHKDANFGLTLFGTTLTPAWIVICIFVALASIGYMTSTHGSKAKSQKRS